MESNTFKSKVFGGFAKDDVVRYIENTSNAHAEEVKKLEEEISSLQSENHALLTQNADLSDKNAALEEKLVSLESQDQENRIALAQLRETAQTLSAEVESLRSVSRANDALRAELTSLRQDAESYRQFRNCIGDIECDARKRAAELQEHTHQKLLSVVTDFNSRYQQMTSTFNTTADYVTAELRKIDVVLSQLPRAFDQLGSEVNTLQNSFQNQDPKE